MKEKEFTIKDLIYRFDKIDARLDSMDARFDAVDARFDAMDKRLDSIDAKIEKEIENLAIMFNRQFSSFQEGALDIKAELAKLDERSAELDRKIQATDPKYVRLETRLERLEILNPNHEKRISSIEKTLKLKLA